MLFGRPPIREDGRAQVDEAAIFKAVEQMRTIEDDAAKDTRSARRNKSQRAHLSADPPKIEPPQMDASKEQSGDVAQPFADFEEW